MKSRFQYRNRFIAVIGALQMAFLAPAAAGNKPNVMFIFADDHSYEALAAHGNSEVKTPNLDRLVGLGVSFTHCYNMGSWSGAVCVASRAMLNSGRFVNRAQVGLSQFPHWSELMHDAGYTTYMTGKWHVRGEPRFDVVKDVRGGMPNQTKAGYNRPLNEGHYNICWKPWDPQYEGFWKGGTHWSKVVADNTLEFFDQVKKDDKPFFMYLAFNAPHDPRQSPKEYVDMYPLDSIKVPESFLPEYPYVNEICGRGLRDEVLMPYPRTEYAVKVNRQEYYAIITHMDHHIGRMLDALEKSGKLDNTIVIFTADHGLAVGHHGLAGKQNMYEHSMRAPFIIAGPGIAKGKILDTPIYLQDAMATALELAGVDKPEHVEFKSVMPLLRGETKTHYDRIYGKYLDRQRMIRNGDWKLIFYPRAEKKMRLFNLAKDPQEKNDLIDNPKYASTIRRLKAEFLELQKEMGDELDLDAPPTPERRKPQRAAKKLPKLPPLAATVSTTHPVSGKHDVATVLDRNLRTKYFNGSVNYPVLFTFDLKGGSKRAKSYTIVSGNDMPGRDPRSWELLGSADGKRWIPLDKRTDEEFTNRFQARTFRISDNKGSFKIYRLQVSGSSINRNGVQFCEFNLEFESKGDR